ncbi:hypothetical protein Tco_0896388 [Tanacetum coccineum]
MPISGHLSVAADLIFLSWQFCLCLCRTSVEDAWSSGSHFFDSFSNCSLKILLGSSKTCIFPSILFTGSFPLMEKLSSLLTRLNIESSRLAQNQQEFLDEYLPQWDENLAIQKKESESEWVNPFAEKRGENHTILHLSKEENDNDDLPYPKFQKFKQMAAQIIKKHEEHAFPSSSSQIESTQSYQPPHDSIMGPPVYPPAQQNPQPFYKPDYQFGYPQGKSKIFNGGYGEYYNSQWTLPPAWTESGVMLVLPADPGLWSEVISRWESITINRLNNQTWSDNKAKLAFVENLLGESEKLMWQQWRTAYPGAYSALEAIADEPQNITSQVRQLILLEDPYRGSTDEQDRAYRDLDRITCEDTKNLWSFLEDFRQLATKSGRFIFSSTTKSFLQIPPSLSKKIEESFRAKHPGLSSGVLPAIKILMIAGFTVYQKERILLIQSISVMVQDTPIEETVFMAIEVDESDDDLEEEDNQFGHHAFMFHPGPPIKIAEMVQSVGSWKPDKELPYQVQQMIRDQPRVYENKAAMEKKRNYGSQKKAS